MWVFFCRRIFGEKGEELWIHFNLKKKFKKTFFKMAIYFSLFFCKFKPKSYFLN